MLDILPLILLLVVILLAIGQVVAVIYMEWRQRDFLDRLGRAVGLTDEQKERFKFWRKTRAKSEAILGEAELEGVKIVADTKYATRELASVYHDQLRQAATQMEDEFKKFLADLRQRSETEAAGQGRVLAQAGEEAAVAFTKQLEEKLAKTDAELEAYKKTAMDKIKANLGKLLEQIAGVVLGKRMSLADQEDLIIEAFEQAKSEKWI